MRVVRSLEDVIADMRFLNDARLLPTLAIRLQEIGHDALHVTERLPGDAGDLEVAGLATAIDAVLVTRD